jgi:hypothetical protein
MTRIGIVLALSLGLAALGARAEDQTSGSNASGTTQAAPKHHSKLKGAAVGGAGGAVVGGKKGAAVGAAGGALVQHHKNKKAEKAAEGK